MTDPQMLTLALAIVIPLSMLIYSNGRITEAKETLRAEVAVLKSDLTLTMETRFNSIDRKLDEILRFVGTTRCGLPTSTATAIEHERI